MHPGLVLEPLQQVVRRRVLEEPDEVLTVVERVRRVHHGNRLVDRAEGRGALDVHVDVAGHDRSDPVRVGSELAAGEDLHLHPDIGLLDLVRDDLGSASVLGLVLGVAVGQRDLDLAVRTAFVVVAACGDRHERQDGARCQMPLPYELC